jgi:hypothetical protein
MSDDYIKELTYEQLQAELSRRDAIKNSKWPKTFDVVVHHEGDEDEDTINFLVNECGFIDGSDEFRKASSVAYEIILNCKVSSDGEAEIVGLNGRPFARPKADLVKELLENDKEKSEAIITALYGKSRSKSHVYAIKSVVSHNEDFEVTVTMSHFLNKETFPTRKTALVDKAGNFIHETMPGVQIETK